LSIFAYSLYYGFGCCAPITGVGLPGTRVAVGATLAAEEPVVAPLGPGVGVGVGVVLVGPLGALGIGNWVVVTAVGWFPDG
jgi:hypothetical protein